MSDGRVDHSLEQGGALALRPSAAKLAQSHVSPQASLRETRLGRHCEVLERSVLAYADLGDFSYVGNDCMISDAAIGRFCAIAAHVRIGAPNHPMDRPSQHRFTYCPEYYDDRLARDDGFFADRRRDRVTIGHDVWIGHGVIVLPGVSIGDGAVLAAGAVVSRDVAPYTVVAGVPARRLKDRFPPALAARLQALAWWDAPAETILANVALFRETDITAFCAAWERLRADRAPPD